jgi:branched-subunit amino acid aminotransferase/4-amino-4-deoxychorismate lyase
MTAPGTIASTALQLWALTPEGPRALPVAATTGTMHDAMDPLPDGVYSALRTFQRTRFLELEAHLERTQQSMDGLGWRKRLDRDALRRALHAIVTSYAHGDARIRFDVLPEPFELAGTRSDVFVGVSPHADVPRKCIEEGVRVDFAPHLSRSRPRIKTTAFVKQRRPLPIGTQERFDHLLVDEEGRILEFSSANVAFVRGDELITAGDGVLDGITLRILVRLAPSVGLRPRFERLHPRELASVDEAILSSSVRGPVPVVMVEDTTLGSGRPGPRTRALTEAYYRAAEAEALTALGGR